MLWKCWHPLKNSTELKTAESSEIITVSLFNQKFFGTQQKDEEKCAYEKISGTKSKAVLLQSGRGRISFHACPPSPKRKTFKKHEEKRMILKMRIDYEEVIAVC
ncbi:hypothetical protein CEXT_135791 [Caerostris extrusa]|uniref:Uncharacterized protein n=1 Tax=Caerostris extrusa TaxID=172846 RepID=A0AAV4Q2P1_CAEEX|nr:hypothetical protein CEXT_135791 [Caerostris extrusa]